MTKINKIHGTLIEDSELTERVKKLEDAGAGRNSNSEAVINILTADTLNDAQEIVSKKAGEVPVYVFVPIDATLCVMTGRYDKELSEEEVSALAESVFPFPFCVKFGKYYQTALGTSLTYSDDAWVPVIDFYYSDIENMVEQVYLTPKSCDKAVVESDDNELGVRAGVYYLLTFRMTVTQGNQ